MCPRHAVVALLFTLGLLGASVPAAAAAAEPPPAAHPVAKMRLGKSHEPRVVAAKSGARAAPRSAARAAHVESKPARAVKHPPAVDLLSAAVIDDKQLANERGGTETNNANNANGMVSGNTASQLTTGANTISQGSFANSSGIPIVIQNTGNNVLIQNSTILNLQLTNPQ